MKNFRPFRMSALIWLFVAIATILPGCGPAQEEELTGEEPIDEPLHPLPPPAEVLNPPGPKLRVKGEVVLSSRHRAKTANQYIMDTTVEAKHPKAFDVTTRGYLFFRSVQGQIMSESLTANQE